MVFDETIVKNIFRKREYQRLNNVSFFLSEWVDIGDGDEYQNCLNFVINRATGNVSVVTALRFHGGQKVYLGRNCGVIDLNDIPSDVFERYRNYQIAHNKASNIRKRKIKMLKKAVSR